MIATKLVRIGAFETNSSSCHSLTIGSTGVFEGFTPDADNVVRFAPGEFGWGPETLIDVESRLSYAYIYATQWSRTNANLELFKQVVCEHTGAIDVEQRKFGERCFEDGYIDHQSVEDGLPVDIFADAATLKAFLFDSGSEIFLDNDNH